MRPATTRALADVLARFEALEAAFATLDLLLARELDPRLADPDLDARTRRALDHLLASLDAGIADARRLYESHLITEAGLDPDDVAANVDLWERAAVHARAEIRALALIFARTLSADVDGPPTPRRARWPPSIDDPPIGSVS